MAVDRAALHEFITGSKTLGQYPNTLWGQVERWRRELLAECRARKVYCVLTGSQATQVHSKPDSLLTDVAAQTSERWADPDRTDGRSWSLAESIMQINLCVQALDAADRGSAPVTPGEPTKLPAGTSQGTLTWAAKTGGGDSSAWGFQKDLIQRQWNNGGIQTSSSPVPVGTAPDGSRGLVFNLPAGQERLEVQPPVAQSIGRDQEVWLGFWFVGDGVVERDRDPWSIIAQYHGNDTTSPQQIIAVDGGDLITGNGRNLKRFFNNRVKANQRYNVVTRIRASNGGPQSVWVNGELVLDNFNAGLNNLPLYLKTGLYRQPNGSPNQTIWMGGHKIGTGYGAVYPG